MKIALVHDQLAEFGGAERVLMSLKKAFPDAPLYTSFVDQERLGKHRKHFETWEIHTSWIGRLPFFRKLYSPLRFFLPFIWSSFDLSGYDVVICSSSWGMCKGVALQKTRSPSNHHAKYVCYLHTPPRYLYGYDESTLTRYWPVKIYALVVNHFLRQYDYLSSQAVDSFVFNASEIRARSLKFYHRDGIIVHPPIKTLSTSSDDVNTSSEPYYLTVSRLAPTKHIDILIHAANRRKLRLIVVGTGNQERDLRAIAGDTITFMGSVDERTLATLYKGATAFLYASMHEDFGMVPVEAMAYEIPVIAHASGGVLETVGSDGRGILYHSMNPAAVLHAVDELSQMTAESRSIMIKNAKSFADSCDEDAFVERMRAVCA